MFVNSLNKITIGCVFAFFSIIAFYSSTAFAEENKVCTSTPESCKSGSIIIIDAGRDIFQPTAKYCDFNKSIMGPLGGTVVCVRK